MPLGRPRELDCSGTRSSNRPRQKAKSVPALRLRSARGRRDGWSFQRSPGVSIRSCKTGDRPCAVKGNTAKLDTMSPSKQKPRTGNRAGPFSLRFLASLPLTNSSPGRIRTSDQSVNSRPLYRLSYRGPSIAPPCDRLRLTQCPPPCKGNAKTSACSGGNITNNCPPYGQRPKSRAATLSPASGSDRGNFYSCQTSCLPPRGHRHHLVLQPL